MRGLSHSLLAAKQLLKDVADNINELKRRLDVSKYVESLQKRLLGWNGPDLVTFGQLKDAGDFKVSDSSNKKSNRQVLWWWWWLYQIRRLTSTLFCSIELLQ